VAYAVLQLLSKLRIAQNSLTEDDVAFMVTPRINAASRMGVPMDAFKLLTAETDTSAAQAADHLDHINTERKGIVASLVKEVKKTVRTRHSSEMPSAIVLGNPNWRPSLLGLAANSCAEEFDRPVFLWGRDGDNIVKKSTNMAWYTGPTIREQLDLFKEPEKPVNLPLRMPIQDVYNIPGIGVVPVGRIETGKMKTNDKIIVVPARDGKGIKGEVKSIEMHHEVVPEAISGDNIGFNVRGITKKDIARGDVLGHESNPPTICTEFTAQIVVLNHPTVITKGYTPVFHIHTAQVACQIVEITKKLDPATGQVMQENPDFIKNGDAAIVKIKPTKPLVIEKQKDIPHMARFAVRDAGSTVAAGMCIDLVAKQL